MLLKSLKEKGIMFKLNNEKLSVKVAGGLSEPQRNFIKLHKLELIAELNQVQAANEKQPVNKLKPFLNDCCNGLDATPEEIIAGLITPADITDIHNGDIDKECITAHIQAWIAGNKQKIN